MKNSRASSSWAHTRQCGRRHFIITRGLLLFGLPLGIFFFVLGLLLFEPRDIFRATLYVPGFLVFGWLYSDDLWRRRERDFREHINSSDENVPKLPKPPAVDADVPATRPTSQIGGGSPSGH
jgi:hypothetical protein